MDTRRIPFVLLLLFLVCFQAVAVEEFRTFSRDARAHGIDFSYAKAAYNEERAGFEINRIIPLVQNPQAINGVKFFIGASRDGVAAEKWSFSPNEYPVEWHVLVDVSKSMAEKMRSDRGIRPGARAAKALQMVGDMLERIPAQDRIIIHFFATDFVQVADVAAGASRQEALAALTPAKVKEVGQINSNGDNTTLYPMLAHYVNSKLADRQQESHRVVVLLTDGVDESANQQEQWGKALESLVVKGIRMNVFLIAPPVVAGGNDASSVLTARLAPETGGAHSLIKDLGAEVSTAPMVAAEHAGSGSFFLPLKREEMDTLKIQFLEGNQLQAAVEWTKEAVLATAGPAPRSAEEIAAEEARAKAAEQYKALPPLLEAAETALKTLEEQEKAKAAKEASEQADANLTKAVEELIKGAEAVKAFNLPDYAVLKEAVEDEAVNAKLQELILLHPLTQETVLALLGRTPPQPQPSVVIKESTPRIYFWGAGVGVALLALLVGLYVARIRRMKREQADWQRRMDSLKAKVPVPYKPVYGLLICMQTGQEWPIYKEAMTIGRAEDNDIVLADGGVSGHHCVLKKNRDGAWVLNDLSSNNGIYCQGRVFTTLNMLPEVSFILGRTELLFRPKV